MHEIEARKEKNKEWVRTTIEDNEAEIRIGARKRKKERKTDHGEVSDQEVEKEERSRGGGTRGRDRQEEILVTRLMNIFSYKWGWTLIYKELSSYKMKATTK